MWIWRRMERVKWIDKIKNAFVLERVGDGRIMLELIKKRKKMDGTLAKKKLPVKGMVNGKKFRGRRRYQL